MEATRKENRNRRIKKLQKGNIKCEERLIPRCWQESRKIYHLNKNHKCLNTQCESILQAKINVQSWVSRLERCWYWNAKELWQRWIWGADAIQPLPWNTTDSEKTDFRCNHPALVELYRYTLPAIHYQRGDLAAAYSVKIYWCCTSACKGWCAWILLPTYLGIANHQWIKTQAEIEWTLYPACLVRVFAWMTSWPRIRLWILPIEILDICREYGNCDDISLGDAAMSSRMSYLWGCLSRLRTCPSGKLLKRAWKGCPGYGE